MKVSIITVVYNGVGVLEKTIRSVASQDYPEKEYIVIDGASKDGTVELLKAHADVIQQWISEPDKGLYDAMNKGLKLASGDFVIFLNAGDCFYNDKILSEVFTGYDGNSDILYGETLIVSPEGAEIGMRRLKAPERLEWKSMINGMVVCHQSVFVRRTLAPQYNLNYRVAADYDWIVSALRTARSVQNSGLIISRFLDGGINKKNIIRALRERFSIMRKNYGLFRVSLQHLIIGTRFFWYWLTHGRF